MVAENTLKIFIIGMFKMSYLKKIAIGSCKFMQVMIFLQKMQIIKFNIKSSYVH